MVQAEICGFLPSDFAGDWAPPMDLGPARVVEYGARHTIEIRDARRIQAGNPSEAEFFERHGFVLLPHATAVKDWDEDIGSVYVPEIERIIRERLLPDRRIEVSQSLKVTRRGRSKRHFAEGVHSDGPLTVDSYAFNVGAFGLQEAVRRWRQSYAREEVSGLVSIDFWRTTNMDAPLRHMPLALCDPNSVEGADMIPTTTQTVAPAGRTTHHIVLRHNPGQEWYYYPEMTSSEVIAFKMCEFWKDDPDAAPQNVFHTAFCDPSTPPDAEERQSCEHRAAVFILRD